MNGISYYDILSRIGIAITSLFISCETTTGTNLGDRPNIVWLIAEDVSPDLGCYGNSLVKTPQIDKLANNGIKFENAFASCPVCSPSRSAFITGMYQSSIGAEFHDTMEKNKLPLPEEEQTLPDILYDNGYFVDYNGKTHFNFKYDGAAIKDRQLEERKKDQPFFLVLQTKHTHRPFKRDTLRPINPDLVVLPPYYPDHAITRRDWANYLEDVQHFDDWVGEQMRWLEENNLLDNTIIVFFGDHGRPHVRGKQFLYDEGLRVPLIITRYKKNAQKESISEIVSLIDLAPTMLKAAGLPIPDSMHGIDILSDINREYIVASRSRMGDAVDKMRAIRTKDYLFIKNFMPEVPWMQLSSYKKSSYPVFTLMEVLYENDQLTEEQSIFMSESKPEFELYNLINDPFQLNNIAYSNRIVTHKFIKILEDWQKKTNDIYTDPDESDLQAMILEKRENLKKWYIRNGLSENPSNEEVLEIWYQILSINY